LCPWFPAERSCRENRWRPAHQARVFRPAWGCPAALRTSGSHLAHGRWVALSAGLPGDQPTGCFRPLAGRSHTSPPAELLAMARQAHARITTIPGAPHLSMISNPGTITSVILAAAHATT
jgi:pimeloyl-ACP methyl ester carboxylesterase